MLKPPFDPKSIKPGEFEYLTRRKLEGGEVLVWRRRGEKLSGFVLQCPHCGSTGEGTAELRRRPYRIRCPSCGKSVSLPKFRK